jgi:hypothetical protein
MSCWDGCCRGSQRGEIKVSLAKALEALDGGRSSRVTCDPTQGIGTAFAKTIQSDGMSGSQSAPQAGPAAEFHIIRFPSLPFLRWLSPILLPFSSMKTQSRSFTNFLLGIIAAEVVFLTVEAFADRWRNPWSPVPHPVPPPEEDGPEAAPQKEEPEDTHLTGSLQGFTEKLKDPAWAGMLAANAGNIALTDAERAVPMPKSAQFVERLDRNPYVGKGMKNHDRD